MFTQLIEQTHQTNFLCFKIFFEHEYIVHFLHIFFNL